MRNKLRLIVEDNTSHLGRIFDYFIQMLILLSLIAFSIETLPNNSLETKNILSLIEITCVSLFFVEYILRIFVAKKPLQYIFSFYGIIDLLAILPFYLRAAIDLRALRAFRIFEP